METRRHVSHKKHALGFTEISEEVEAPLCDGCLHLIRGHAYTCKRCNFWLHESCVQLPRKIKHSEHKLSLDNYRVPARVYPDLFHPASLRLRKTHKFICDACGDLNLAFGYHCAKRDFSLDIKCASLKDDQSSNQTLKGNDKRGGAARYGMYELTVCNIRKELEIVCEFCKKLISGVAYICHDFLPNYQIEFFLHESCIHILEREADLKHPFHTRHLLRFVVFEGAQCWTCKVCLTDISDSAYGCIDCKFYVHVSCSSYRPRPLAHACHEHDLFYFNATKYPESARQKCEICKGSCTSSFYRCCDCEINFHLGCMPLPPKIKCEAHNHPLVISGSFAEDNSANCHSCGEGRDAEQEVYVCEECPYFAHIECLLSMRVIQHFSHEEHALCFTEISDEVKAPPCNGCMYLIRGHAFTCRHCNFWLHELCAQLPREIEHPLHSEHKLTLEYYYGFSRLGESNKVIICDACGDLNLGFGYHCNTCDFSLDIKCASLKDDQCLNQTLKGKGKWKMAKGEEYYHFTLCNIRKEFEIVCEFCEKLISGLAYIWCSYGYEIIIFLHESCEHIVEADFKHPFHTQHPLRFVILSWGDIRTCKVCLRSMDGGTAYKCISCRFGLHVSCSSYRPRPLKHACHEHDLFYFNGTKYHESARPKCEVCKGSCTSSFYRCCDCEVNFHLGCMPLLPKIKCEAHEHSLVISGSSAQNNSVNCHSCGKERDAEQEVYVCEECPYFAHIECLMPTWVVYHARHKHALYRNEVGIHRDNAPCCNGCSLLIINGSAAYFCSLCNFWLHKSCLDLPSQIQHPNHSQHGLLTLLCKHPHNYDSTDFICDHCGDLNRGFTFHCKICFFKLDVKCATQQGAQLTLHRKDTFTHFCHDHQLTRCNFGMELGIYCVSCLESISGPACACCLCQFYIHESCVNSMQQEAKSFYHDRWHTLSPRAMGPTDLVTCNACLVTITGIAFWCKECKFNLHVSCSTNDPTRALKHECHRHDLYYFQKTKLPRSAKCEVCDTGCDKDSFFRCVECDVNLHLSCALPSTVKHKWHRHSLRLMDYFNEAEYLIDHYCDICETQRNIEHEVYACEDCLYVAHIECVASQEKVHHFGHWDALSFSVVMRGDNNAPCCDGCGHLIHDPAAYTCSDCNFWLHKSCFELPEKIIQHPLHLEHSLHLRWREYDQFFICNACRDLCSEGLYYGGIFQDFHLDLKCSFLSGDGFVPHEAPERVDLGSKFLSSSSVRDGWVMTFKSCIVRKEHQVICDACKQLIQGQAYAYLPEYYFHEFCLSDIGLGIEIYERSVSFHSQHRFQLGIIDSGAYVKCNACRQKISGVALVCEEDCNFILHFSCAKYETRALRHQCHEHDLLYFGPNNVIRADRLCHLCGRTCSGPFLSCMDCDFDIHLECVPLPFVVKHSCHWHALKLTDGVKNDSVVYNCHMCMEKVNPEHQVYSCEKCTYIAHIDCVNLEDEPPEEILSYLVPQQRQMTLDSDQGKATSELDKKGEENDRESSVPNDQLDEKITKIKALMEEVPIELLKALVEERDKMLCLKP